MEERKKHLLEKKNRDAGHYLYNARLENGYIRASYIAMGV